MKKRLKGGIVVSGGGAVLADVVLDGEKVAAVGLPEEMELLAGAECGGCGRFRLPAVSGIY